MPRSVSRLEIVERFQKAHGLQYDYSNVVFTSMKAKVEIICPTHGSFWQTPDHHARGTACPECMKGASAAPKMAEAKIQFSAKSLRLHGGKYDYSTVDYRGNKTKVGISCHKHGLFFQTPSNHLSGFGCPACGRARTEASRKLSSEEFFRRCNNRHAHAYTYPNSTYCNPESLIIVSCQKHGNFQIKARNHLWIGQGCRQCYLERKGEDRRVIWKDFHDCAVSIHGTLFEYDESSYFMLTEPLCIKCSKHGWFEQRGHKHLAGQGCPKCAHQLHRGKWSPETIPHEMRGLPCALYYFRLSNKSEYFYKIGISNDVERRRKTIGLKSGYEVKVIDIIDGSLYDCMVLEESLLREFSNDSYLPSLIFPGYTECFSSDVLQLDTTAQ